MRLGVFVAPLAAAVCLLSAPSISAQCKCKKVSATSVAGTNESASHAAAKPIAKSTVKTGVATKPMALANGTCPVSGKATSGKSPTAVHAGHEVRLCCTGCAPKFAKLDDGKKSDFVAMFASKAKPDAGEKPAKSSCCSSEKPPVAAAEKKGSCCSSEAATSKPAAKKGGCCSEKKASEPDPSVGAAKKSCCQTEKKAASIPK